MVPQAGSQAPIFILVVEASTLPRGGARMAHTPPAFISCSLKTNRSTFRSWGGSSLFLCTVCKKVFCVQGESVTSRLERRLSDVVRVWLLSHPRPPPRGVRTEKPPRKRDFWAKHPKIAILGYNSGRVVPRVGVFGRGNARIPTLGSEG